MRIMTESVQSEATPHVVEATSFVPSIEKPLPSTQCSATTRGGANAGQRCRRMAITGASVCYTHGGQLPSVRAAAERLVSEARLRLIAAAPGAADILDEIAQDPTATHSARVRAATEILARAGVASTTVVHTEREDVPPSQIIMERLERLKASLVPPVD